MSLSVGQARTNQDLVSCHCARDSALSLTSLTDDLTKNHCTRFNTR